MFRSFVAWAFERSARWACVFNNYLVDTLPAGSGNDARMAGAEFFEALADDMRHNDGKVTFSEDSA